MPDNPAAPTRSATRLLTPGLAWLVGGLVLALIAVVLVVLLRPAAPGAAWAEGVGAFASSLAAWIGGLFGVGCGVGAALNGMLLLIDRDRAERAAHDEGAPLPPVGLASRLGARALVSAGSLAGALGVGVAALALPEPVRGPSMALLGLAGVLAAVGIASLGALFLASRGDPSFARVEQPPDVGLTNPVRHVEVGFLVLLVVVAIALQLTLVRWVVEDAAISYAYARNLAAGDGLVTFAGGERIEGYSNPLWTFLMAGFYAIGIDGWVSSKGMALVFGGATIPLVWAITREARPHRADATPLIAAAIAAGSAQLAIWHAGGLENSLLNVLIALGIWRSLIEARRGGVPWSALAWLGVALTRPEGILYAALGGFWTMIYRGVLAARAVREARAAGEPVGRAIGSGVWPTLAWLGLFFVPFGAYHIWRFGYFAWEFPNTFYAKKGNPTKAFEPFEWKRRGWKYVRQYGHQLWHGYLLPIYVVGLLGRRGVRGGAAILALVALGAVLLVPGPDVLAQRWWWSLRVPDWWVFVRVWTLLGVAVLSLPFVVGRPGWRALVVCESVAVGAMFFAIYAGGDWMGGFRWFATVAVPAAVLLAVGIGEVADAARPLERWRWLGLALAGLLGGVALIYAVGLFLPPMDQIRRLGLTARDPDKFVLAAVPVVLVAGAVLGWRATARGRRLAWGSVSWTLALALLAVVTIPAVHQLDRFLGRPTTSPNAVRKRVNYMNWVQDRLHMEGRPTTLDVDMGANMYWSGDKIVDVAGLVDVSMGHHWFETEFVQEYIFEERRPDFAHVHGGWARTSHMKDFTAWNDGYVEIPPYPTGKRGQHPGNHVRKDHIVVPAWDGPAGRDARFDGDVVLVGWDVPGEEGVAGGHVYVELAWSTSRDRLPWDNLRTLVFISGPGGLHTWELPPGYDWYKAEDWREREVVLGRYSLPVPADLAHGEYALGVVMLEDPSGRVLHPVDREPAGDPVLSRSELRWPGAVRIVDAATARAHSLEDVERALGLAVSDECEAAVEAWRVARRRSTRTDFDEENRSRVAPALAACWARSARRVDDRALQLQFVRRAREWDHREPTTREVGRSLADAWLPEADAARAAEDWETAYAGYRDVLVVDPTRAWARRRAEEARDCRLGIRLDQHDCGDAVRATIPLPDDTPRGRTRPVDLEAPILELAGDEEDEAE